MLLLLLLLFLRVGSENRWRGNPNRFRRKERWLKDYRRARWAKPKFSIRENPFTSVGSKTEQKKKDEFLSRFLTVEKSRKEGGGGLWEREAEEEERREVLSKISVRFISVRKYTRNCRTIGVPTGGGVYRGGIAVLQHRALQCTGLMHRYKCASGIWFSLLSFSPLVSDTA